MPPSPKNSQGRNTEPSNLEGGRASQQEREYPPLKVVVPSMICVCLVFFLAALDRTIVGIAVPAISDEFKSFKDVSWYQAAFTLTNSVFQLPMGKIYTFFPAKWSTVASIVIFEVGSVVCASAPSSIAFIIGRAITGIGAAGIIVGAQVIIRDILPLQKRPKYQGALGATFGLSSIIGPLMGGAFTENVTWRWSFWISLPIGGVALAGLVLLIPYSPASRSIDGSISDIVKRFDPVGNAFLFPGVICILLALQWGDVLYPWNNARIIALLVLGIVLLIAFCIAQLWAQENGTVPPRIIRQRTIAAGTVVYLAIGAVLVILAFYLPIWFQVVLGTSAGNAGVRLLPYFLSTVIFTILTGVAVSKIGYYTPILIAGTALLIVGTGLMTTFRVGTGAGQWIGFQVILGAGLGLSLQQPVTAVQAVLPEDDIPTGITVLTFAQSFGSTIFVSVSQAILSQSLTSQLAQSLPGFDGSKFASGGITDIRRLVPQDQLMVVLHAYNAGIVNTFYCALGAAALAMLASLFFEWKTVRKEASEDQEMQDHAPARSETEQ